MATPASPNAPDLESGVKFKKGTSVFGLEIPPVVVCANNSDGNKNELKKTKDFIGENFIGAI
jgi:hypothetical protein